MRWQFPGRLWIFEPSDRRPRHVHEQPHGHRQCLAAFPNGARLTRNGNSPFLNSGSHLPRPGIWNLQYRCKLRLNRFADLNRIRQRLPIGFQYRFDICTLSKVRTVTFYHFRSFGCRLFSLIFLPFFRQKPLTWQEMSEKIVKNCVALESLRFYYEK